MKKININSKVSWELKKFNAEKSAFFMAKFKFFLSEQAFMWYSQVL